MARSFLREVYEPDDYEVDSSDDYEPERWELPALTPQRVAEATFLGLVAWVTGRWIYNKLGWDFGQGKES